MMMTRSTNTRKEQLRLAQKRRREAQKAQGKKAITVYLPESDVKKLKGMKMDYNEAIHCLLKDKERRYELEEQLEELKEERDDLKEEVESKVSKDEIKDACKWVVEWIHLYRPEAINDELLMKKLMHEKLDSAL